MSYRVSVRMPTTTQIRVKNSGGVLQPHSTNPITIPTVVAIGGGSDRFDGLDDVVEGTPENGWVVTYRSADDKYVVEPISNVSITLDGGTF